MGSLSFFLSPRLPYIVAIFLRFETRKEKLIAKKRLYYYGTKRIRLSPPFVCSSHILWLFFVGVFSSRRPLRRAVFFVMMLLLLCMQRVVEVLGGGGHGGSPQLFLPHFRFCLGTQNSTVLTTYTATDFSHALVLSCFL